MDEEFTTLVAQCLGEASGAWSDDKHSELLNRIIDKHQEILAGVR